MNNKLRILTMREYRIPYTKLLLSSAILALFMPIVALAYVALVLSVGFSFIPFTLVLGVPIIIIGLGTITAWIVSRYLADIYYRWNVTGSATVSFATVLTYLAFYYGLYFAIQKAPYGYYSEEANPNYFGIDATSVSIGIFIFCFFSPIIYTWLYEHAGKAARLILILPLALFFLNTTFLNRFDINDAFSYPESFTNTHISERQPAWVLAPQSQFEPYTFYDCFVHRNEISLNCRMREESTSYNNVTINMSEYRPELERYTYRDGVCELQGLAWHLDSDKVYEFSKPAACSVLTTEQGRRVYISRDVETIYGRTTFAYFIHKNTIVSFDGKLNATLFTPEKEADFLRFVDSFN